MSGVFTCVETVVQSNDNKDSPKRNPFYIQNNNNNKVVQDPKNIKFEDIQDPLASLIETNTIVSEKPKEIKNEKKEENKNKEWGDVNMDPFASAKVVETVVQSTDKKQDENKNQNIKFEDIKDPLASIIETNTIVSEKPKEPQNNINTQGNNNGEWGNVNMDPFASAKVVETIVESNNKKDNDEKDKKPPESKK